MRRRRILVGCAVMSVAVAGCGNTPREFRQNQSLRIVSPTELQTVTAPAQIRWVTTSALPANTRFAIFIDTPPLPPGRTLRSMVRRGDPCLLLASCPDATWFQLHGVRLAPSHEVAVDRFPILGGVVGKTSPVIHQVTIVPIDTTGRRIGAATYSVRIRVADVP
jgi:hypothetical protein